MAMLGTRDKPTYYDVVGEVSRVVYGTASASRVQKLMNQLQALHPEEKLVIELKKD